LSPAVKGGLAIGILCTAWTYVMGFTGWYLDPALSAMFWVVVLLECGALVWGYRLIGGAGRRYGSLVTQGILMALIGGVIIFVGSLLFTSVVFPDYFAELQTMHTEMLRAEGMSASQIEQIQSGTAFMQTPLANAVLGFLGTVVTGALASLVIAAVLRTKTP